MAWTEEYDESSKSFYYFNHQTGETQWDPPDQPYKPHAMHEENNPEPSGEGHVHHGVTKIINGEEWVEVFDDDNNAHYYANLATGESTWETPLGWADALDSPQQNSLISTHSPSKPKSSQRSSVESLLSPNRSLASPAMNPQRESFDDSLLGSPPPSSEVRKQAGSVSSADSLLDDSLVGDPQIGEKSSGDSDAKDNPSLTRGATSKGPVLNKASTSYSIDLGDEDGLADLPKSRISNYGIELKKWERHWDPASNQYYYSAEDGMTQWEKPVGWESPKNDNAKGKRADEAKGSNEMPDDVAANKTPLGEKRLDTVQKLWGEGHRISMSDDDFSVISDDEKEELTKTIKAKKVAAEAKKATGNNKKKKSRMASSFADFSLSEDSSDEDDASTVGSAEEIEEIQNNEGLLRALSTLSERASPEQRSPGKPSPEKKLLPGGMLKQPTIQKFDVSSGSSSDDSDSEKSSPEKRFPAKPSPEKKLGDISKQPSIHKFDVSSDSSSDDSDLEKAPPEKYSPGKPSPEKKLSPGEMSKQPTIQKFDVSSDSSSDDSDSEKAPLEKRSPGKPPPEKKLSPGEMPKQPTVQKFDVSSDSSSDDSESETPAPEKPSGKPAPENKLSPVNISKQPTIEKFEVSSDSTSNDSDLKKESPGKPRGKPSSGQIPKQPTIQKFKVSSDSSSEDSESETPSPEKPSGKLGPENKLSPGNIPKQPTIEKFEVSSDSSSNDSDLKENVDEIFKVEEDTAADESVLQSAPQQDKQAKKIPEAKKAIVQEDEESVHFCDDDPLSDNPAGPLPAANKPKQTGLLGAPPSLSGGDAGGMNQAQQLGSLGNSEEEDFTNPMMGGTKLSSLPPTNEFEENDGDFIQRDSESKSASPNDQAKATHERERTNYDEKKNDPTNNDEIFAENLQDMASPIQNHKQDAFNANSTQTDSKQNMFQVPDSDSDSDMYDFEASGQDNGINLIQIATDNAQKAVNEGITAQPYELSVDQKAQEEQAAIQIQAAQRGYRDRKNVAALRQEQQDEQEKAAIKIQSSYRGHHDRNQVAARKALIDRERQQAATKIQSTHRGHQTRKQVATLKESVERDREQAATQIQSLYRGHQDRKKARAVKATAEKECQENAVAVQIQSVATGNQDRGEVEDLKKSIKKDGGKESTAQEQKFADQASRIKQPSSNTMDTTHSNDLDSESFSVSESSSESEDSTIRETPSSLAGTTMNSPSFSRRSSSENVSLGTAATHYSLMHDTMQSLPKSPEKISLMGFLAGTEAEVAVNSVDANAQIVNFIDALRQKMGQTKLDNSATKIQSLCRGHATRRIVSQHSIQTLSEMESRSNNFWGSTEFTSPSKEMSRSLDKLEGDVSNILENNEDAQEKVKCKLEKAQVQNQAAIKIQTQRRGFSARRDLAQRHEAATKIQALHRGSLQRAEIAQSNEAATKIQAWHRGLSVKSDLVKSHEAATKIQALCRGSAIRSQQAQQHDAATKLQACHRGSAARLQMAQVHGAATKIQACYRGSVVRQSQMEAKKKNEAATKLQPQFRGFKARSEMNQLAKENGAATKIQAVYRGSSSRAQMDQDMYLQIQLTQVKRKKIETEEVYKNELDKIQDQIQAARALSQREYMENTPEETETALQDMDSEAATKIQALYRGHQVRAEMDMDSEAATKIQALYRGHKVRAEMVTEDLFAVEEKVDGDESMFPCLPENQLNPMLSKENSDDDRELQCIERPTVLASLEVYNQLDQLEPMPAAPQPIEKPLAAVRKASESLVPFTEGCSIPRLGRFDPEVILSSLLGDIPQSMEPLSELPPSVELGKIEALPKDFACPQPCPLPSLEHYDLQDLFYGTKIYSIPPPPIDVLQPEWAPLRMVIRPPSSNKNAHNILGSLEEQLSSDVPGGSFRNGNTVSTYKRRVIKVKNPTKNPITVSDKLHFSDINDDLEFDRGAAWGFQLKEMMLFPPRAEITVVLVPLSKDQRNLLAVNAEKEAARRRRQLSPSSGHQERADQPNSPQDSQANLLQRPMRGSFCVDRSQDKSRVGSPLRPFTSPYVSERGNKIKRQPIWRDEPEVQAAVYQQNWVKSPSESRLHQDAPSPHRQSQQLWRVKEDSREELPDVQAYHKKERQRKSKLPSVDKKSQNYRKQQQQLFNQQRAVYEPEHFHKIHGEPRARSAGFVSTSHSAAILSQTIPDPIMTASGSNLLRTDKRLPQSTVIGYGWGGPKSADNDPRRKSREGYLPTDRPRSSNGRVQRADILSRRTNKKAARPEWSNDFRHFHKTQKNSTWNRSRGTRLKKIAKLEKYYQTLLEKTDFDVDDESDSPVEAFGAEVKDFRDERMQFTTTYLPDANPGDIANSHRIMLSQTAGQRKKQRRKNRNYRHGYSSTDTIRNSAGHLLVTRNTTTANQRLLTMLDMTIKEKGNSTMVNRIPSKQSPSNRVNLQNSYTAY